MVYSDRVPEIRHIACGEFKGPGKRHTQSGVLDAMALAVEQVGAERGLSPNLGWSHYRTLMNVENQNGRLFYEIVQMALKEGKEVSGELVERLVEGLAENQKTILELIIRDPRISKKAMAQAIGISTTAIDKNLTKLKQRGILRRVGPDKGGHWEVVR